MQKQVQTAPLMAASLFMDMMDGTIVTSAIPRIAEAFHVQESTASLLVSSYIIALAVLIPLSGWLGERYGHKKIWMYAVGGFTITSFLSALSTSFHMLLAMRIMQGISASLMTPTARIIVMEKTPPKDMLRMTSFLIWPALIAPALAPVLGGILVTSLNWHWIFLVNIPLGIVCLLLGQRLIPPGVPYVDRHFDSAGFAEIATMSTLLLAAGDMASRGAVYYRPSLVLLAIGLVIGLYFCRHLCRAESPLFSPWPMKIASFRISQTGESFLWLSVGALPYLLTVFLQSYFGWSPVKAGMYILFIFLGNIGIKPFTTFIIEHIRYKKTFYLAFFWILISSFGFALTTPSTPGIILIILAVVSGMGRSLSLTAYNGLCFSELRHEVRNDANTLTAVTSNLATGLGISLITVVNAVSAHIAGMEKGYKISFLFLGILMIYPIIETSTLPDNIGENTLKR